MAKTPESSGSNPADANSIPVEEDAVSPERTAVGGDIREYYERYLRRSGRMKDEQLIKLQIEFAMENLDLVRLLRDMKKLDEKWRSDNPQWGEWFDHLPPKK